MTEINNRILEGDTFYEEISNLGYDRYSFHGNSLRIQCLLWAVGETVASIDVDGPTILIAACEALSAARFHAEYAFIESPELTTEDHS